MRPDQEVIRNLRDLVKSQERELNKAHAEIAALEEQAYRLGDKWAGEQIARARERDEARAEVAALREAVRYAYQNYMDLCEDWGEGAEWLDRPAVRRALEEKP